MATISPVHVQKYLRGVDYPVRKADLVQKAKQNGADDATCQLLDRLPDEEFEAPVDVSEAVSRL